MTFAQSDSERQAGVEDGIRAATEKGEGWGFDFQQGRSRRWHFFRTVAGALQSLCGAITLPAGTPDDRTRLGREGYRSPRACKACLAAMAAAASAAEKSTREPELAL